jgi:hypothetical protein
MSWTFVNSGGTNNAATSGNTTLSWSPTIGNVLFAATANYSANIGSISDGHNTWTRVSQTSHSAANGTFIDLWTAPVTTGGALTITAAGQSSGVLGVLEVMPSGTVSADGSPVISVGLSTTPGVGSISIAGGDLVLAVISNATTPFAGWTVGSGYTTAFAFPYTAGVSVALMFEYALSVSGPTTSPSAGFSTTPPDNTWSAIGAAFLAAAGFGAPAYPAALLPCM